MLLMKRWSEPEARGCWHHCWHHSARYTQKHRSTTSKGSGLSKRILQRQATPRNRYQRNVAPQVARDSRIARSREPWSCSLTPSPHLR